MSEGKHWIQGMVCVEIRGQTIDRFFNIAAQRELYIVEIQMLKTEKELKTEAESKSEAEHKSEYGSEAEVILFSTTPNDFKKMKPIAKKTEVRLKIIKKSGLPFLLYQNRKRKYLAIGMFCFFLMIYSMTFFIWDISVDGNYRVTDQMLLHFLQSVSIEHGIRKSVVSCEELEGVIRDRFSDITWVSAEIKGTRLLIHIKENEVAEPDDTEDTEPCDLAALRDGVIRRCVVRNGICMVKEGDEVQAGDLLVDGTIPIYDDAGTLVNAHEIHADAEIYAETNHQIEKNVDAMRIERCYTGRIRNGRYFRILDASCYLMLPKAGDEPWEYVLTQTQLHLTKNFYLPIYVGTVHGYEYQTYEKNYTEIEIQDIADTYLQEYMEKLQEKGIQILGSDGKIEQSESGWRIVGNITVIENIAKEIHPEIRGEIVSK